MFKKLSIFSYNWDIFERVSLVISRHLWTKNIQKSKLYPNIWDKKFAFIKIVNLGEELITYTFYDNFFQIVISILIFIKKK